MENKNEKILDFFKSIEESGEDIRERFQKIADEMAQAKNEEDAKSAAENFFNEITSFAKEKGYNITKEEFLEFFEKKAKELSDEDLAGASGGLGGGILGQLAVGAGIVAGGAGGAMVVNHVANRIQSESNRPALVQTVDYNQNKGINLSQLDKDEDEQEDTYDVVEEQNTEAEETEAASESEKDAVSSQEGAAATTEEMQTEEDIGTQKRKGGFWRNVVNKIKKIPQKIMGLFDENHQENKNVEAKENVVNNENNENKVEVKKEEVKDKIKNEEQKAENKDEKKEEVKKEDVKEEQIVENNDEENKENQENKENNIQVNEENKEEKNEENNKENRVNKQVENNLNEEKINENQEIQENIEKNENKNELNNENNEQNYNILIKEQNEENNEQDQNNENKMTRLSALAKRVLSENKGKIKDGSNIAKFYEFAINESGKEFTFSSETKVEISFEDVKSLLNKASLKKLDGINTSDIKEIKMFTSWGSKAADGISFGFNLYNESGKSILSDLYSDKIKADAEATDICKFLNETMLKQNENKLVFSEGNYRFGTEQEAKDMKKTESYENNDGSLQELFGYNEELHKFVTNFLAAKGSQTKKVQFGTDLEGFWDFCSNKTNDSVIKYAANVTDRITLKDLIDGDWENGKQPAGNETIGQITMVVDSLHTSFSFTLNTEQGNSYLVTFKAQWNKNARDICGFINETLLKNKEKKLVYNGDKYKLVGNTEFEEESKKMDQEIDKRVEKVNRIRNGKINIKDRITAYINKLTEKSVLNTEAKKSLASKIFNEKGQELREACVDQADNLVCVKDRKSALNNIVTNKLATDYKTEIDNLIKEAEEKTSKQENQNINKVEAHIEVNKNEQIKGNEQTNIQENIEQNKENNDTKEKRNLNVDNLENKDKELKIKQDKIDNNEEQNEDQNENEKNVSEEKVEESNNSQVSVELVSNSMNSGLTNSSLNELGIKGDMNLDTVQKFDIPGFNGTLIDSKYDGSNLYHVLLSPQGAENNKAIMFINLTDKQMKDAMDAIEKVGNLDQAVENAYLASDQVVQVTVDANNLLNNEDGYPLLESEIKNNNEVAQEQNQELNNENNEENNEIGINKIEENNSNAEVKEDKEKNQENEENQNEDNENNENGVDEIVINKIEENKEKDKIEQKEDQNNENSFEDINLSSLIEENGEDYKIKNENNEEKNVIVISKNEENNESDVNEIVINKDEEGLENKETNENGETLNKENSDTIQNGENGEIKINVIEGVENKGTTEETKGSENQNKIVAEQDQSQEESTNLIKDIGGKLFTQENEGETGFSKFLGSVQEDSDIFKEVEITNGIEDLENLVDEDSKETLNELKSKEIKKITLELDESGYITFCVSVKDEDKTVLTTNFIDDEGLIQLYTNYIDDDAESDDICDFINEVILKDSAQKLQYSESDGYKLVGILNGDNQEQEESHEEGNKIEIHEDQNSNVKEEENLNKNNLEDSENKGDNKFETKDLSINSEKNNDNNGKIENNNELQSKNNQEQEENKQDKGETPGETKKPVSQTQYEENNENNENKENKENNENKENKENKENNENKEETNENNENQNEQNKNKDDDYDLKLSDALGSSD